VVFRDSYSVKGSDWVFRGGYGGFRGGYRVFRCGYSVFRGHYSMLIDSLEVVIVCFGWL